MRSCEIARLSHDVKNQNKNRPGVQRAQMKSGAADLSDPGSDV